LSVVVVPAEEQIPPFGRNDNLAKGRMANLRSRFVTAVFAPLVVLTAMSSVSAPALDRNAFTFTQYNLQVQVEPQQQRLSVRGTIVLRNDSSTPQKSAALQISSSLTWRSILLGEQAVQFVSQPYTSDIDHTGELSEAIVTLPKEVAPGGTIELTVGYEGLIVLDPMRQTRIGVPEQVAVHSDWDSISKDFTAVRGVGYVTWYPVAIDAGNLSEGDSLFEVLGTWKARSAASKMQVSLCADVPRAEVAKAPAAKIDRTKIDAAKESPASTLLMNDVRRGDFHAGSIGGAVNDPNVNMCGYFSFEPLGLTAPAFVIGPYETMNGPGVMVYFSPAHKTNAEAFVQAAQKVAPFVTEWVGSPRGTENVVELDDPGAAPFETGSMLLTPLHDTDPKFVQLAMVHELVHAALAPTGPALASPGAAPQTKSSTLPQRPWIEEGLAHFLQGVYREHQEGRAAALDFMGLHRAALVEAEKAIAAHGAVNGKDAPDESLLTTATEELVRSKAAWAWWMLRDMIGEDTLKRALAVYRSSDDTDLPKNDPKYLQRLLEKESKRDLAWFFDDWVYHDRGLPDFRVVAVFTRATVAPAQVTTVTVENVGGAGAEVPVSVLFDGGEVRQMVLLKAHDKQVLRVETQGRPTEVVVGDGSAPESEMGNNVYRVEPAGK
jgi:hypothetical protein